MCAYATRSTVYIQVKHETPRTTKGPPSWDLSEEKKTPPQEVGSTELIQLPARKQTVNVKLHRFFTLLGNYVLAWGCRKAFTSPFLVSCSPWLLCGKSTTCSPPPKLYVI